MNKTTDRYLRKNVESDLKDKMVFISGPRQVGKTTLAKAFIRNDTALYLNWDDLDDRELILHNKISKDSSLIVLDEVHKYKLWRTLVKGIYDKYSPKIKLIITGSARLDYFRKGGDSLAGRYHMHRLHPFTLPEISDLKSKFDLLDLLSYGGFPEPLHKSSETFYKRWRKEMKERIISQDLRDLSLVRDISMVELLAEALPSRVGLLLSIRSLSEDLQVSPNTVESWIAMLEKLFFCYRISPYGTNRLKAVKKTQKLYLWDWATIPTIGPKFENLVASHLLKFCHHNEDSYGDTMELRYLKDVEGREVDFVVIKNSRPLFMVECKYGESSVNPALKYYRERLKIKKAYQVHADSLDYGNEEKDVRVLPFKKFCEIEKLV